MIFTIGYQCRTLEQIAALVEHLNGYLIDVRSTPSSRKPGFSKKALSERLQDSYVWAGDTLGGKAPIKQAGLDLLAPFDGHPTHHAVLMCLEHAPGDCHRHMSICGPHFPHALHIYNQVVIEAGALAQAIIDDTDDMPFLTPEQHKLPL